jgi:hypothetical protein
MFALAGVFFTGVDFETVAGLGSTGVSPVVFLFAVAAFEAGVEVASFLTAVGMGFLAAAGVGFDAALGVVLDAVTGVFLTGVEAAAGVLAAGLLVEAGGSFFTVPSGVLALAGVAFAGVGAFGAAGEAVDVPAELSFLGTLFTGAVAESVALLAEAAGFFTGVALVAFDVAVFAGVAVVFFADEAVPWATFEMLPMLAMAHQ